MGVDLGEPLGAILGLFWTVSGLRAERKDETWRGKADVRSISQNVHDARARAPFCGILGPFWGHLAAILGHLGAILGPCWTILGPSWAISTLRK